MILGTSPFAPALGPFLTAGGKDGFQDPSSAAGSEPDNLVHQRLCLHVLNPSLITNSSARSTHQDVSLISFLLFVLFFFFLDTLKNRSQLPAFLQLEREDEGLLAVLESVSQRRSIFSAGVGRTQAGREKLCLRWTSPPTPASIKLIASIRGGCLLLSSICVMIKQN